MEDPRVELPRNPHCSNCGDTRGGSVGHETSECTWDSKADANARARQNISETPVPQRQTDTY